MKETNFKYNYVIPQEKLLEYSNLSIEDRLNWLEEANEFLHTIQDDDLKKKWQKFREMVRQ